MVCFTVAAVYICLNNMVCFAVPAVYALIIWYVSRSLQYNHAVYLVNILGPAIPPKCVYVKERLITDNLLELEVFIEGMFIIRE